MNITKKGNTRRLIGISMMALACMAASPNMVKAQVKTAKKQVPPPPPPSLPVVDRVPQFPGGQAKLAEYIKKNLRYPEEAKKKNVTGKVMVSFFVEDDGNINDLAVVKGIGAGCDVEALRIMRDSPKWQPSIKNGKPVRAKMVLPITFALPGQKVAEATSPTNSNATHAKVDKMPEFPGGVTEFYKYLAKNLKYPEQAQKSNVQGKVFVNFIVQDDGSITDAKVLRGIGSGCDEEALRVITHSPKWVPAMLDGEPVSQEYTVPLSFKLAKN